MSIDVTAQTVIQRSRDEVARYATNPANDPIWIGGIVEARLLDQELGAGSRVARVATFLGKRIEYVNEVVRYEPRSLLVMEAVEGPFPMTISYRFDDSGAGTRVEIRVQGETSRFYRLASPILSRMVKRSIRNDLATLEDLLENDVAAT